MPPKTPPQKALPRAKARAGFVNAGYGKDGTAYHNVKCYGLSDHVPAVLVECPTLKEARLKVKVENMSLQNRERLAADAIAGSEGYNAACYDRHYYAAKRVLSALGFPVEEAR